jgi:hypothetical protein
MPCRWRAARRRPSWCCAGARGANEQSRFYYERPRALADGWAEWRMPALERPAWCEAADAENVPYTLYANHPCTFLQAGAAAAAAAG